MEASVRDRINPLAECNACAQCGELGHVCDRNLAHDLGSHINPDVRPVPAHRRLLRRITRWPAEEMGHDLHGLGLVDRRSAGEGR